MQASLTNRARWPWWLAAALVAVPMAFWWQPWVNDAVVPAPIAAPAPAPAPTIAQRLAAPHPSSPAPEPPQPAAPAPSLKLVGTAMGGASNFAIVRRTTDSQLLRLRVGDRVDGLAVAAIEPDRIVLAGAAQPIVIHADRTAAVPAPPLATRAVASPSPASQVQPPEYAEGEAPWDLAPPFKH
jgi:hypothetical protein